MTTVETAVIVTLCVCVAYLAGYRDGYRRAQWEQDCEWMDGRIRQACGYDDMFPVDWDARADELFRRWDTEHEEREP